MSPLLSVEGLSVSYGGVRAVQQVDLEVDAGQIVGLIGPNGAGKTSFIDAVTGFVDAAGRVVFGGRDVSRCSPDERAVAGLRRTWQSLQLFDDLTVRENLQVALGRRSLRQVLARAPRPAASAVLDTLDELRIAELADAHPPGLSQGQRKLVDVARALVARPSLICMDEPAAGLDSHESRRFGTELRRLADAGTSVLLVDHDMGLVLDVCDAIVVLDFGQVIARGTPSAIRSDSAVIAAYLGVGESGDAQQADEVPA